MSGWIPPMEKIWLAHHASGTGHLFYGVDIDYMLRSDCGRVTAEECDPDAHVKKKCKSCLNGVGDRRRHKESE